MKTLVSAPVYWSEKAVGTRARFCLMAVGQAFGCVCIGWFSKWQSFTLIAFYCFLMPLYYLIALRGVLSELHKKPEPSENVVATY